MARTDIHKPRARSEETDPEIEFDRNLIANGPTHIDIETVDTFVVLLNRSSEAQWSLFDPKLDSSDADAWEPHNAITQERAKFLKFTEHFSTEQWFEMRAIQLYSGFGHDTTVREPGEAWKYGVRMTRQHYASQPRAGWGTGMGGEGERVLLDNVAALKKMGLMD